MWMTPDPLADERVVHKEQETKQRYMQKETHTKDESLQWERLAVSGRTGLLVMMYEVNLAICCCLIVCPSVWVAVVRVLNLGVDICSFFHLTWWSHETVACHRSLATFSFTCPGRSKVDIADWGSGAGKAILTLPTVKPVCEQRQTHKHVNMQVNNRLTPFNSLDG